MILATWVLASSDVDDRISASSSSTAEIGKVVVDDSFSLDEGDVRDFGLVWSSGLEYLNGGVLKS